MANLAKILALLVVVAACGKPAKPATYYLDRIQYVEGATAGNPAIALGPEEVRKEIDEAFERSSRFVPLAPSAKPRPADLRAMRAKVEVAFTREILEEDGRSTAEVGVSLELKRLGQGERHQLTGVGRVSFPPADAAARVPSFRKALAEGLDEAMRNAILNLEALDKKDEALVADLSSDDPRKRDFAVQTLADRKNAAAVPALVERLKDPDREVAMRAVGALGSIGDPRAVPALIEMGQTRDPPFLVALIDVVAQLGGKDAEAFLFTLASGHPEDSVRRAAQEAQERLAAKKPESADANTPRKQ